MSRGSVGSALASLNSSSAAGPDGLQQFFCCRSRWFTFSSTEGFVALPLLFCILFVRSLEEGMLASLWKTSTRAP